MTVRTVTVISFISLLAAQIFKKNESKIQSYWIREPVFDIPI